MPYAAYSNPKRKHPDALVGSSGSTDLILVLTTVSHTTTSKEKSIRPHPRRARTTHAARRSDGQQRSRAADKGRST